MSVRLNFNPAALRSHFQLAQTDRQLATSLERLSSGVRIRRAADDPAGLSLANNLRHHITGVSRATDNIEEGIAMMNTAEAATNEISDLLLRLRELTLNAANTGANSPENRQALQNEFDEAVGSITRIASNTSYGGINLLDGTLANNRLSSEAETYLSAISHDDTQLPGGVQVGSTISVDPASATLTKSTVSATFAGPPAETDLIAGQTQGATALTSINGDTMTVTGPDGELTINLNDTLTFRDMVGLINAQAANTGVQAQYDSGTGVLTFESLHYGDSNLFVASTDANANGVGFLDDTPHDPLDPLDTNDTVNGLVNQATNQTMDLTYVDDQGLSQTVTLTQDGTSDGGLTFTDGAFSVTLRDDNINTFGGTLAAAPNALTATREGTTFIQVGAQSGQIQRLEIEDLRAGALGHTAVGNTSGYTDLQNLVDSNVLELGTDEQIADALRVIDASIDEVSTTRARVGAQTSDSLERALSSLRVAFESLTTSESLIRDTDFAEESAEYSRLNIQFQASTSMLAQANQLPNTILQLLQ